MEWQKLEPMKDYPVHDELSKSRHHIRKRLIRAARQGTANAIDSEGALHYIT